MLSRVQYTADGSNKTFTVPFPYINKTDVKATINGFQTVLPFLWATDSSVTFQDFLAAGDAIEIYRETQSTAELVTFTAPATLTTADLNLSQQQSFYLVQELLDRLNETIGQSLAQFPGAPPGSTIDQQVDAITQSILNSALLADLNQRIGDIDANAESILQQIARVDGHQTLLGLLGAANATNTAFILNTDLVQVDASTTLAQKFSGLVANIGTNTAAIATEATTRADAVSSLSQQISILVAGTATFYVQSTAPVAPNTGDVWYDSSDNNHPYKWDGTAWIDVRDGQFAVLAAQITTEQTARTDADTATAQTIALLGAVNGPKTAFILDQNKTYVDAATSLATKLAALATADANNAAAISTEQTARISADGALSSRVDTVTASAASNATAVQQQANNLTTEQNARIAGDNSNSNAIAVNTAAIQTEQTARADGDSANATSIQTVQTTVNGHTTSIATQASSINGLLGQYTVKVDNNGYVAGFGLASYANDDGTHTSQFLILADQFAVVKPGLAAKVPFVVDAATGTIAIDGTLLVKGSILTDALHAKAVTADKISVDELSALAANLGTVTGGLFRTATSGYRVEIGNDSTWPIWYGTGAKSAANGLFYVDQAGNVTAENFTLTGNANSLQGAAFSGGLIDPSSLRIDCGGGRRAPITIEDSATVMSNSPATLICTLATLVGPGYGSGFNSLRLVDGKMDVFLDGFANGDGSDSVTIYLQKSTNGGAWTTINSDVAHLNFRGTYTIKGRYTTNISAGDTIAFRMTNSGTNCLNMSLGCRVYNYGPSTNIGNSFSVTTGASAGGSKNTPPVPPGGYIP